MSDQEKYQKYVKTGEDIDLVLRGFQKAGLSREEAICIFCALVSSNNFINEKEKKQDQNESMFCSFNPMTMAGLYQTKCPCEDPY